MVSRIVRGALVGLGSLAFQIVAGAVGLVALAGAATATSSPWAFLPAGLVAYGATLSGLVWLVVRKRSTGRKQAWWLATGVLTLLAVIGFSVSVLRPIPDPRSGPNRVAGLQWWTLSDGARLAYTHTAPDGPGQRDPVVFLHGGPGIADLAGDTAYFGQLAGDGYDVYVYDQVGTGHSARLPDPTGYTLERWTRDLEEIRRLIDTDRMILIGHSWGARIALRYLDQHPERVSRLILSTPGAIPGSDDHSGDRLADSLPAADRRRVFSLTTQPRMLASYGLLQINPEASRNLTPDAEIDARMDQVYNASRPALHCPGKGPGPELHGLGFYAHQYPQSARSPADPDIRDSVTGHPVPTLVVKGQCDYLSWSSAIENLEALPDSTLVYLEDAGHNAYQDRPDAFFESVRSFLRGDDTIPSERHDTSAPDGYEGPP